MKELWTTEKAHTVRRVFNAVQELNALVRQAVDLGLDIRIEAIPTATCNARYDWVECHANQPITDFDIP